MPITSTGESVLSHAVRLLDAFRLDDTALQVCEIAGRAGLHVATTSRLIAELVELGLLSRGPDRRVRIGVRMSELASRASPALSLREVAMPYMEDLHAVAGQHTQLGVLDSAEVLFLERLSAPGAVLNITRIAGRLPLHARGLRRASAPRGHRRRSAGTRRHGCRRRRARGDRGQRRRGPPHRPGVGGGRPGHRPPAGRWRAG